MLADGPRTRLSLSWAEFCLKHLPEMSRRCAWGGESGGVEGATQLPLPSDPGQVSLPRWSSVFPSVKWQDRVTVSPDTPSVRDQDHFHGGPCLFQDGDLEILNDC